MISNFLYFGLLKSYRVFFHSELNKIFKDQLLTQKGFPYMGNVRKKIYTYSVKWLIGINFDQYG